MKFIRASDLPPIKPPDRTRWRGWTLDGIELSYPAYAGGVYPIRVDRFTSSAAMLDMVMQVAKKDWATDKVIAGLVRALNDILEPQATLCSCGTDKRLTPAAIRARVKGGVA